MNLYESPKYQNFNISGVLHIAPQEAFDLILKDEIYFIDVRESSETRRKYFDFQNVFFHPMSVILDRLKYIPKEIPLIIVCDEGVRSTKVANLLIRQEYKIVANLDGGIKKWEELHYPIVSGGLNKLDDFDSSCNSGTCGCSCSGCGQ
jgi:rhodanese-related sulfurtransferase